MIGVVESRADPASEHICERLREVADWTAHADSSRPDAEGGGTVWRTEGFELRSFETLHLETEGVAAAFDDPDTVVFASRHAGETGRLLTAHFTGNFGGAEYGGEPSELAAACPNALAYVLEALEARAPERYDVSMECTHHGPSRVGAPAMFVEVGSAEPQWEDADAAAAVARSILALRGVEGHRERQLAVFGGGHYAPRATRLTRETDWAVGHVAPDWALEALDETLIEAALAASRAEHAIVEGDRSGLAEAVEAVDCRVVSETWVRAVEGVPLATVQTLEAVLGQVEDGLRFGTPAQETADPEVTVGTLPAELVAAAAGVDEEAVFGAARATALAFETREGGTRLGERAAFPPDGRTALVDRLTAVLEEEYEAVERHDDRVVAHERAFDPALASELGVPEGPAFGRLAEGESVELDGRTIPPDAVRRDRRHEFPL